MKKYNTTSNLNVIQQNDKWYVSTSNKQKFYRNTEKDTKAEAEKEAVIMMLREAEWRYHQIRMTLEEDYNMSWQEIDDLIA